MDNQILDTISYAPEGHQDRVSFASREHLLSAAKWSRFTGITFSIFFAIFIIALLVAILSAGGDLIFDQIKRANPSSKLLAGGIVGAILIIGFLGLFLLTLQSMISFGNNMKWALQENNQELFEKAMSAMKRFWLLNLIMAGLGALSAFGQLFALNSLL